MPGYWIIRGSAVKDQAAMDEYARLWTPLADKYGARFIIGGGRKEAREGADFFRVAMLEFPSYEQALACYDDPHYQAILPVALRAYERELTIVEGR